MRCKKAEKLISRLVDGRLDEKSQQALNEHVKTCPACARTLADYKNLQSLLRSARMEAEPLPYFEERLKARLSAAARPSVLATVERWYAAAVPVFLIVATVAIGLLFLLQPSEPQYSQAEMLLFENQNPLKETQVIFDEEKPEVRQLKLLFAGLEGEEIMNRGVK
ncbi:MAG: zf-HC2 domain-containing protein [Candidatus Aminicenantes bacterium]|nr:zf-HC2 domain-containing protein [Candidatus Aminicenantes bacterium]